MNKFLKKDSTIKVMSIIIAIILWFYVVDIQNPEAEITVKDIPVKIINAESIEEFGLSVMNKEQQSVSLVIRGRRKSLANINNKSINAYVDLKGLNKSGEYPVMIQVELPIDSVDIIDKKPYNQIVKLDHLVQLQKEIKVQTKGTLPEGYVALKPEIKPNTVTLKGPSNVMNSVEDVRVLVDLNEQKKDISIKQKLEIFNKSNERIAGDKITLDTEVVDVLLSIIKIKEVPVVVSVEGAVREELAQYKTFVTPDKVKITGKDEILDKITQIQTSSVNLGNITKDMEFELQTKLPEGISLFESPDKVVVRFDVERQITRSFQIENINVVNVPEGMSYTLLTKKLNISLRGNESRLKSLDGGGINISADIGNYDEGTYDVPVKINAGNDISAVEAYTVSIKLLKQSKQENSNLTVSGDG